MKFTMEQLFEIWDDESGTHLEIGSDRDGLGCIEIRYRDEKNVIGERMTFAPEQVPLIIKALSNLVKE